MAKTRKDLIMEDTDLWYLVGLITSDGCLSKDQRHIDVTSKDYNFLRDIVDRLSIPNRVGIKNKGTNKQAYRIQIANKSFYEFLLSIGLTQNKSLTLGEVKVPNQFFVDFLRGLIDGDGCIRRWIHPSNKNEQWSLRIYSGSHSFIDWLKIKVEFFLKVKGKVYGNNKNTRVLKYGKMAAREIVKRCYYKNCFGLLRKIKIAQNCIDSFRGWRKSSTINF